MTADPYQNSAGVEDPGSWNRYSYVGGDPANMWDPTGLAACSPGSNCVEVTADAPQVPYYSSSIGDNGFGGKPPFWLEAGSKRQYLIEIQCRPPLLPSFGIDEGQLDRMIDEAKKASEIAQSTPGVGSAGFLFGFLTQFLGEWNFKDNYPNGSTDQATARFYGNFAYGAVLQSLNFTALEAQSFAGMAQILIAAGGGANGDGGFPFVSFPYQDQVVDQTTILKGFAYQRNRSRGLCP